MGLGYTPIHTMQASNGTSTAISRSERSTSFSFTLLSSGLKITRCSAGSRYIAATTTPAVAMIAARGYVRKVPSSTRNSPTNPLVAGSPMDDSETIVSTAASIGTTFAMPPNASIRRECRRSYSMPARKNSAPVEMPWLIITSSAHAPERERPDAEHHEAEVRDRRVGDQLLEVGLDHRHQAAVQNADQRQRHDDPLHPGMQGDGRKQRQRESQETVGPHLEQDPGEQHGPRRGGFHVRVGEPGVEREHRHLDREREEEGPEQPEREGPESADVRRQLAV